MSESPPASTPSLGRLAARHLPLIVAGFGLAALLLAGTATPLPGVRDWAVELRALGLVYPPMVLLVLAHVRRRAPELLGTLLACFLIGFVIRLVALLAVTDQAYRIWPERTGAWYDDAWWYSVLARLYAQSLTGQDYAFREILTSYEAVSRLTGVEYSGALPSFVTASAGLVALAGFSMVGYMLPWTLLGAFWAIQLFLFLRRVVSPVAARVVLFFVLLAPDYVLQSTAASKDLALAIPLIWAVELGTTTTFTWRRLPALVGLGLLVLLIRPELVPYVVTLVLYLAWRPRLREDWLRRADVAVVLLVMFAGGLQRTPLEAFTSSYLAAWVGNLLLVPMPYWLTNMAPRDLTIRVMASHVLAWPVISSLLVVAAVLQAKGRRLLAAEAWLVVLTYHSVYTAKSFMTMTAVRWRVAIAPWLLAAAVAAVLAARQEPPAVRRRLALAAGLYLLGLLALNLLLGGRRFLWS